MEKKVLTETEASLLATLFSALAELQAGTNLCPFFDWSGHVNCVNVKVAKNRKQYTEFILDRSLWLTGDAVDVDNILKLIREVKRLTFDNQL
jgi:hypothetical protein